MFQAVPFNPDWVSNDKCDIKAIYRRKALDRFGEPRRDAAGAPLWDLTGPLPVRRHHDWAKKGFEYVTLADMPSLLWAAKWLRDQGRDPNSFLHGQGNQRGPWNAEAYLATQQADAADTLADLKKLVEEFGLEAVTKIKRQTDPTWQPPAGLKGKK